MSEQSAYPLSWPVGWKRTPAHLCERGRFDCTPDKARREMLAEIDRIALGPEASHYTIRNSVVVSTNMPLRKDGEPMVARSTPNDPGVAVYFTRKKKPVCFACDKYDAVWKNMRAIQKTIEALRGIERWGSSQLLERAFTGFTALPEKTEDSWQEVLGLSASPTIDEIRDAWRTKAKQTHPDAGGTDDAFRKVQAAFQNACQWWDGRRQTGRTFRGHSH